MQMLRLRFIRYFPSSAYKKIASPQVKLMSNFFIVFSFSYQLSDEKIEAAQRETRLQNQLGRQRLRIEELTTEKNELLERIKRLEESRLAMQNAIAEERASRSLDGSNKLHRNVSLNLNIYI